MNQLERYAVSLDSLEGLRARLAKYEDADGKPITTIAEQAREIASLRNIISECATACGAAVSVECSEEFMAMLPDEIRTVMAGKTREIERLSLMVSQADHNYDCDRSDWQRELAALKAQPSGVVLPELKTNFDYRDLGDDGYIAAQEWNAAIKEVARLNSSPVSSGPSRGEQVREQQWQLIHDTLRNYRMGTLSDGEGGGYPLIDAMTADGQSVSGGIEECTYLADAILNVLAAAPSAGGQKEQE